MNARGADAVDGSVGPQGNPPNASLKATFSEKVCLTMKVIEGELEMQGGLYLRGGKPAVLNQSEFCKRAGIRAHTFYASSGRYRAEHARLNRWLSKMGVGKTQKEAARDVSERIRSWRRDLSILAAKCQLAEQKMRMMEYELEKATTEIAALRMENERLSVTVSDGRVVLLARRD